MKIRINSEAVATYIHTEGDLFISPQKELYVLTYECEGEVYRAVCLNDGLFWDESTESKDSALDGLEPFLGTAEITG